MNDHKLPVVFEILVPVLFVFLILPLIGCGDSSGSPSGATVLASGPPKLAPPADGKNQWFAWRGPNGNGIATRQRPPTVWDKEKNVVWKTKIPGRGHASPTVVGNQVILATAIDSSQTQAVVSYDLATGNRIWITEVNHGGFNPRIHSNNTHASPTVVSDGERLFAVFNNHQSAQLTALDLDGNVLWQKKAGTFIPKRYRFGYGSSPTIHGDFVIVASECEGQGTMAALNRETGELAWSVPRGNSTSYSTPVVAQINGRDELVLSGGKQVVSHDPNTGESLWAVSGPWQVTCGTAVWDGEMVFVSGGFPQGATLGINANRQNIVWRNAIKCYEQSMLAHDGYVYSLSDRGILFCWRGSDGQEMWKERLASPVSASPVLANGHIYISVESGTTFVFKANPSKFEAVAENQLGDSAFATPSFVGNQILARVGFRGGDYQEWLYCIGQ